MKALAAVWLTLGLMLGPTSTSQAQPFNWPGGARAAISLSYDDALPSQLDIALPALNAHGLKASFYLTLASETVARRLPEWRQAAAQGHELGNHTLFHPCSRSAAPGRDWVAAHRDLDRMSVAQLREEILLANVLLQAIDGRSERSFTAPCGDLLAGGEPYLPAIRPAFLAIKSRSGGLVSDLARLDLLDMGTADPSGLDGEALIALVEQAAAAGGLLSLSFHGVGGEYLSVTREAHETLLRHLAAHPQRYWVASTLAIARHLRLERGQHAAPGD